MKDITIGCDPEFYVGYYADTQRATPYIDYDGGGDGDLRELRPQHSDDPLEVVDNIRKCLEEGCRQDPEILKPRWAAGSYSPAGGMGGHIHFGSKVNIDKLDNYLAPVLMALERKSEWLDRRGDGYGALGDYRNQTWGVEYRAPSSWLTSPEITSGVLCLAKVVADEIKNADLPLPEKRFRINRQCVVPNWCTDPNCGDFDYRFVKPFALKTIPIIKTMRLYRKYARHIDFLFALVEAGKTWFPKGKTMKEAWGLKKIDIKIKKFCFSA